MVERVVKGTSESVGVIFQSFQKMANVLIRLRLCLDRGEKENKTKHTNHDQHCLSHNYLLGGGTCGTLTIPTASTSFIHSAYRRCASRRIVLSTASSAIKNSATPREKRASADVCSSDTSGILTQVGVGCVTR